jgi:hypothetical protein
VALTISNHPTSHGTHLSLLKILTNRISTDFTITTPLKRKFINR